MSSGSLNCLKVGSYTTCNLYPITVLAVLVLDVTVLGASSSLCLNGYELVNVINSAVVNFTASAGALIVLIAIFGLNENPCGPVVFAVNAIGLSSECKYSKSCNAKNNCHENCCKLSHCLISFSNFESFSGILYHTNSFKSMLFQKSLFIFWSFHKIFFDFGKIIHIF